MVRERGTRSLDRGMLREPWFLRPPSEQRIAGNIAAAVNAAVVKFVDRDGSIDGYEVAIGCLSVMSAYIADLPPSVRKEIAANTHTAIDSLFEAGSAAAASEAEDETYEIGKRDGYEQAIQELDIATGGDGEFKGSTIPGATVDVPAMRQRILDRFAAANEALDQRQKVVVDWGKLAFGAEHMADKIVRAARFFEEAAEMVQAVGLPRDHAQRAFDHAFSRPAGDPAQEAGGSANTLMALCDAIDLSFDQCQRAEIARCLAKDPAHFAERNRVKINEVDAVQNGGA